MLYSHVHHPLSSRYDCGFDSFCFHLLIRHLFSQFAGSYMDAGVGTAWSNLGLRNLDWLLRTQARPLQIPKLFQPEIALWMACWCWFGPPTIQLKVSGLHLGERILGVLCSWLAAGLSATYLLQVARYWAARVYSHGTTRLSSATNYSSSLEALQRKYRQG